MADEYNSHKQSSGRSFVMPELGSRYQPRRVVPRASSDVRSITKSPAHHNKPPQPTNSVAPPLQSRPAMGNEVIRAKKTRTVSGHKPALPRQGKSLVLKRHMTAHAAHHQKLIRTERKQQLKAFVLGTAIAIVVGGVGASIVYATRHITSGKVNDQPAVSAALGASTNPSNIGADETPVTIATVTAYKTSADKPKVIRIQRMGVQARIFPVSTGFSGEPTPTNNTHDVGWLANSAKPGEPGVMLLNGYVSGPSQPGVLSGLSSLVAGDLIQIEKGDGITIDYKIIKTKSYPADKVNMQELSAAAEQGKPGLNLIANTGRFNVRSNQFEDRIAVWASQL